MNKVLLAACAAAALLTFASPANAALDDQSACQQADERSFSAPEAHYLNNPFRNTPHAQARWFMAQWGVNTNDPFPRTITIHTGGEFTAVCVIDYGKVGGFGIEWHVRVEARVTGDQRRVDYFESGARDCFGNNHGQLVQSPDCGPYGTVDGFMF